jgi:hypothetical protein
MNEAGVRPILFIGVSGATWDVLTPLKEKRLAPNIARLLERGVGASLASIKVVGDKHYRPQVAWACLATGCDPDRHGVTQFFHEAAELREPTLWDIYSKRGLTSGVYGWPGTWPPPHIKGFVVPSHLARDDQTWPPDLRDIKALDREQQSLDREGGAFRRLVGFVSAARTLTRRHVRARTLAGLAKDAPSVLFSGAETRRLLLRQAKLEVSSDVFINLCRKHRPNLAAFVTFSVDFASHRYWQFRGAPIAGNIDTPDWLRDGMEPEPNSAEVGPWYFFIRGSRIHALLGLDPDIQPRAVARWIAFRPVDADKVRAVAAQLRGITVVETGLPLFRVHEHDEEVIIKLALDADIPRYAAGDLETLTVRIGDAVTQFTDVARRSGRRRSAMHARNGIFVIAGPGVRSGGWLSEASILDIAPTLLIAAGLEKPAWMDGKPLNIFM